MDPHQPARVTETAQPFVEWLTEHSLDPCLSCKWDDLLVEFMDRLPEKAEFETLVASVEIPWLTAVVAWVCSALSSEDRLFRSCLTAFDAS